jgi:serine/threonine protein kinase
VGFGGGRYRLSETRSLGVGSEFAGYEIIELAGRGGMGVVYRARNVILGKERALKVVSPELSGDDGFRSRFKRESQIAASIDHPNVIPIYHAGEDGGLVYVVMEYVDGTDLSGLLEERGRLPPSQCLDLLAQVASALDAAHERGLVHRDVKPANVLISGRADHEHAYLTDFGLAKRVASKSHLTQTGVFVGTYQYAAPEQFSGAPVDGRADIYALGCMLFHALSGRAPFERDSVEALIGAHLFVEPPRLSDVLPGSPPGIDDVIQVALAKDPADRYRSAGELVATARRALENDPPVEADAGKETRVKVRPPSRASAALEVDDGNEASLDDLGRLRNVRGNGPNGPAPRRKGGTRPRAAIVAAACAVLIVGAAVAGLGFHVFDGGQATAQVKIGVRPRLPQNLTPQSLSGRAVTEYPDCRFEQPVASGTTFTTVVAKCHGSANEIVQVTFRGPDIARNFDYARHPTLDTLRCQVASGSYGECKAGDRRIGLDTLSLTPPARATALARYRALVATLTAPGP